MTRLAARLAALCVAVWATPGGAETLTQPPPLAPDVAALPRLTGDSAVAARINASLHDLDQTQHYAITCEDENPDGAYRSVQVLSDGPAFLSLLVITGGACPGAAHPWGQADTVNFDLSTGRQTDLMPFLPTAWTDPGPPEAKIFDLYLDNLDAATLEDGCLDDLISAAEGDRLWYLLAIDTGQQRLMILPDGLAHVASGCEQPAWIPVDLLRASGFAPRLVGAALGRP